MEHEESKQPPIRKRPNKKFRGKIFRVIFLILGVMTAVLFGLQYFGPKNNSENNPNAQNLSDESITLVEQFDRQSTDKFLDQPYFTDLLPFTINLKDNRRFLKVTIYIGVANQEVLSYLQQRMPIVKDTIINTVHYRTAEDLSQANGVENLKAELLRKLNQEIFSQQFLDSLDRDLGKGIQRIYFSEFIIQ